MDTFDRLQRRAEEVFHPDQDDPARWVPVEIDGVVEGTVHARYVPIADGFRIDVKQNLALPDPGDDDDFEFMCHSTLYHRTMIFWDDYSERIAWLCDLRPEDARVDIVEQALEEVALYAGYVGGIAEARGEAFTDGVARAATASGTQMCASGPMIDGVEMLTADGRVSDEYRATGLTSRPMEEAMVEMFYEALQEILDEEEL